MKRTFVFLLFAAFLVATPAQAKDDLIHHFVFANYSGQDGTGWIDLGYEFTMLRFGRLEVGGAGFALDFKGSWADAEFHDVVPLLTVPIASISLAKDPETYYGWISFGGSIAFDPKNDWDHRFFFGFRASWR